MQNATALFTNVVENEFHDVRGSKVGNFSTCASPQGLPDRPRSSPRRSARRMRGVDLLRAIATRNVFRSDRNPRIRTVIMQGKLLQSAAQIVSETQEASGEPFGVRWPIARTPPTTFFSVAAVRPPAPLLWPPSIA